MVQKLERDGMVAVIYSPGYGAGWSTWNTEHAETLCFDAEIAQAVLDGNLELAIEIAERKCPGIYAGGGMDLRVEWLPKNTRFEISEYDGSEGVRILNLGSFFVA